MNLLQERKIILSDIQDHEFRIEVLKQRFNNLKGKTQPETITRDHYVLKSTRDRTEVRLADGVYLSKEQIKEVIKIVKTKYYNEIVFVK